MLASTRFPHAFGRADAKTGGVCVRCGRGVADTLRGVHWCRFGGTHLRSWRTQTEIATAAFGHLGVIETS